MTFETEITKLANEIEKAEKTEQHEKVCILYSSLSYLYRTLGMWNRCDDILTRSIQYAKEHGCNDEPMGILLVNLGAIRIEQGDIVNSVNFLKQAVNKLANNPTKLASAFGNLGKAYMYMGKWEQAKKAIDQAILCGKENNSNSNLMSSNTTLARIESERGLFDNADTFFQAATEFERKLSPFIKPESEQALNYQEQTIRDRVHICELKLALSKHKRYQGLFEDAIQYANLAIKEAESIQYEFGINEGNLLLSKCYLACNDIQSAERVLPELSSLKSKSQKAECLLEKAIILARKSDITNSTSSFLECIHLYESIGHQYDKEIATIKKAIYLSLTNNYPESTDFSHEIMTALQKIRDIGIVSENYEMIKELQDYIRNVLNKVNLNLTDIMNVTYTNTTQLSEEKCRDQLQITITEQNRLLTTIGIIRNISRISDALIEFSPNKYLESECKLLLNEVNYLIGICNGYFESTRNYTTLFQNKLSEYKKETDDKNNILLQILQSVFSGIGIVDVFISILSMCTITIDNNVLLFLLLSSFAWSCLPIAVLFIIEKKRKKYIFCTIDIILIIASMIWLFILVTGISNQRTSDLSACIGVIR